MTDGRFADSDPVFTADGLYLAFLSRRTFDPVYDAHSFDLSFPFGARPYLVPLAAHTLSPFGPLPGGRPVGDAETTPRMPPNGARLTVDTDGISSRVVARPGGRGAVLRPRRGQGRPALAALPRCPACSARASPTRTTRTRGPRSSGSTCASARRACSRAR